MNTNDSLPEAPTHDTPEKFYLPAMTVPPQLDRIEAVLDDLLDWHGVVRIPDTYNR